MSKKVMSIFMPLQANSKVVVTSENMLSVLNRIPLVTDSRKHINEADKFVSAEMKMYPVTSESFPKMSKREELVAAKVKNSLKNSLVEEFYTLYLKLEKKLTFL